MYADWTRHISDPKEREEFERSIQGSKRVLQRLASLLDERTASIDASEISVKQFDNPSWAYKQAFQNGFRASNAITKKLINLDQQVIKDTN